jgi:hypothetical protein
MRLNRDFVFLSHFFLASARRDIPIVHEHVQEEFKTTRIIGGEEVSSMVMIMLLYSIKS